MSSYAFNYAFNISGNCNAVIGEIAENVAALRNKVEDSTTALSQMEKRLIVFNQATQYCQLLKSALDSTLAPGAELNAKMAELQAISGATGKELATVEKFARDTAKEFGISASGAVESYKLLLSQLSPELTKNSEALNAMGRNVAILSKTMGNDASAAAEVLTTAMNQYGVSLEDPMEASRKMAEMMNIMAAAGREGSAELPTIKEALKQCGMAAKAAGVSFAETNAAIQVLDKAGKKGSEGGVALRNVMSTLAQGRFLPKDVKQELSAAGVNIVDLTDKSKSLSERLTLLKPVMADSALFSKLFGKENSAAAMALVQGIDTVERWTDAISGTNTAVDQSQIIMETYNEKLARVNAQFDDMKISIFNCCGDLGIWVQVVSSAAIPIAQLVPLIQGLSKAILFLRAVNFKKAFSGVVSKIRSICIGLVMLDTSLTISGGFFTAFKVTAQNACRAIGTAIMNIPIIGWIAAAIAAVIAVIQLLWDKCKGFRIAVFTAWEAIKAMCNAAWIIIKAIGEQLAYWFEWLSDKCSELWDSISDAVAQVVDKVVSAYESIKDFIGEAVTWIKDAFNTVVTNVVNLWNTVVNAVVTVFNKVVNFIANSVEVIKSIWASVVGFIINVINSVVDTAAHIWNAINDFVQRLSSVFTSIWEYIKAGISRIANLYISVYTHIWNKIKGFAQRMISIFVNAFARIKGAFAAMRNWIVGIVNAIIAKIGDICAPLINAFNKVAAKIKEVFGKVLNWVQEKIDSVLDWFIGLYNKIAKVLNWEEIKQKGREAGERSWKKDHPDKEVSASGTSSTPVDDTSKDAGGTTSSVDGGSAIGNSLKGIGGSSGDKTDRIKNINITIDKLIDKFTITTNNLSESRERIKDVVAEALLSAVNDANYAM